MENEAFTSAILGMSDTLYRVAATQLRDDRYVQTWVIRILLNECHRMHRHYGVTQMAGPVVLILNEKGEVLHEEHLYTKIENMETLVGGRIQHNIVIPSEGLAENKITIRLQSWRNHNTIYDEYTYTLK